MSFTIMSLAISGVALRESQRKQDEWFEGLLQYYVHIGTCSARKMLRAGLKMAELRAAVP